MFTLYKFCIRRFGMLFGHVIFSLIFGYIAGIVLLFLFGGIEKISYSPMVVWKNLIHQWNYWTINKNQLGGGFAFKLFAALISPLMLGLILKISLKIVLLPLRKIKQAKMPHKMTETERLQNIEDKLDTLMNQQGKKSGNEAASDQKTNQEQGNKTKKAIEPEWGASTTPEEAISENIQEQTATEDETTDVIIMPSPEKMDNFSSKHPPSVETDFTSKRLDNQPNKKSNDD